MEAPNLVPCTSNVRTLFTARAAVVAAEAAAATAVEKVATALMQALVPRRRPMTAAPKQIRALGVDTVRRDNRYGFIR